MFDATLRCSLAEAFKFLSLISIYVFQTTRQKYKLIKENFGGLQFSSFTSILRVSGVYLISFASLFGKLRKFSKIDSTSMIQIVSQKFSCPDFH